ncbi:MAG TPA: GHMP kinase, partial [Methyloceanibacter sp.]|nr:GHMP kinase [Methyloceanibacter sp.]
MRRGLDFKVTGVDCERAEPYLRAITASFGLATPYQLHLDEVIPAHAGLGSGTQLALAIGSAVA